jgi:hypothetical protein
MFRFTEGQNYIQLKIEQKTSETGLESYAFVELDIDGFSGKGDCYLPDEAIEQFCSDVFMLERTRKGSATLRTNNGEISLLIESIDELGHIGITCNIKSHAWNHKEELYERHASGSFELDPSQLESFCKESWVAKYAA